MHLNIRKTYLLGKCKLQIHVTFVALRVSSALVNAKTSCVLKNHKTFAFTSCDENEQVKRYKTKSVKCNS